MNHGTTGPRTTKPADDLANALFSALLADLFGPPKPPRPTAEASQAASNGEAAQPLADDEPGDTAALAKDARDEELSDVLTFIRRMPTWGDDKVVSVRGWLLDQLRAGAHRHTDN